MSKQIYRVSPAEIHEFDSCDLNELCLRAHELATEKGFWDDVSDEPGLLTGIGTKLALITSEVSEALEEYRDNQELDVTRFVDGKPEGFGIELADIVIRVADLAGRVGVNLGDLVNLKFRYNATRPTRHGKKV